jgi:hypothetical protein
LIVICTMRWYCFTCDNINIGKPNKQIHDNNINRRYCSRCRRLDVLSFTNDEERINLIKKQYTEINNFIDTIPVSYTAIPYYYINYDIVLECTYLAGKSILEHYSMNNMVDYITNRLHYKTYNSWQKYRRNICNKRYRQLVLLKIIPVLSLRPSNEICKFL